MRFLSAKWKALLDGPGNRCASGGRDVRSCLSTTSLHSSSNIMSSKPSLFFTSRQREGEFFKQGCGEKGTTSLSPCSGPSGTNVPLSLFQAEMLNDPEFAKNVKGLELMLRVRDSACSGSVGTVSSGSRVVAGSRCAGESSVGFLDPGSVSGGENNSVNAVSEKRRFGRVASAFAGEISPEDTALVLAAAGKTVPKDAVFILAGAEETVPENAEMALAAAGETDPEDAESVRSLAGAVDRELRRSGPSVCLNAHATVSESTGIIGVLEARKLAISVNVDLASLPGLPGFLNCSWFQVVSGHISGADIAAWPYSVGILFRLTSFLNTLHWQTGSDDLGHFSFLELLILVEQWAGHRLHSEKVTRPHFRANRPILIPSVRRN